MLPFVHRHEQRIKFFVGTDGGLSFLGGFGDGNKKIRQINFQIAAISTTAFKINVDNCLKWL